MISIFSNEGLLPTVAEVVLSTWSAKPLDQKFLDESPSIKLLIHAAGSVHHLVTPALVERGIRVTSAAHLNAIPTAEFALALILTALRNTLAFTSRINAGGHKGWKKPKKNDFLGYYGTRVGLLGFGNVTLHLLKLLQHFDIECYVADPFVDPVVIRNLGATPACLDWVIEHCDVVSLHHASRQNTRHLLNRERISRLKPGAQLINTARGALIDETALVDRLKQGDIHAYLDVTEKEPPPEDHPFYTLPNCQLTPHIAGSLGREVHRFGEFALRELDNWIHQRPLEGEVDLATLSNRG
ncbi:hydroxyacid dehydrogenase [Marinospirillum celere]|uniref:hydroxyacid dehydrogenase n=1 Tax=Marinospirillum celere TaxID=1122252 RepID=UPI0015A6BBCF|nr:hydroxyacid dehydrogenase [Marinospirillum celere]